MLAPRFELELNSQDHKKIVGIDEVGRGSIAGPLLMAAVSINFSTHIKISGVKDSKLLSRKKRELIHSKLLVESFSNSLKITTAKRSAQFISKYGLAASLQSVFNELISHYDLAKTIFLLDAGIKVRNSKLIYQQFIHGDNKIYSIALAAIYAKVERDNYMRKLALTNPGYSFETNVGYGTKTHLKALKNQGITIYHRTCFKPVSVLL